MLTLSLLVGVWLLCGIGASALLFVGLGEFLLSDIYLTIWLILGGTMSLVIVLFIFYSEKLQVHDRILWERKE